MPVNQHQPCSGQIEDVRWFRLAQGEQTRLCGAWSCCLLCTVSNLALNWQIEGGAKKGSQGHQDAAFDGVDLTV